VEDVPEEEFKHFSPRLKMAVHYTPQIKKTPLMDAKDVYDESNIPASTPLPPHRLNDEEKQRAKSMATL
jgi:hypothetical protein